MIKKSRLSSNGKCLFDIEMRSGTYFLNAAYSSAFSRGYPEE